MASYFDEIAANRLKSLALMVIFMALFSGIIYLLVILLGGGLFAFAVGFIVILLYAAFVYLAGDKVVLKVSGATIADKSKYPELYNIIEGLASAIQVPMPKVYTINDANPNAFATGRSKKVSAVAVTTGLLSMMNKRELEGVLAHEMSHISNNDIQFMMIAVVFAGVIGLVSVFIRSIFLFGGLGNSRNNGAGLLLLVGLVIGVLAPIFALLIRLAISRRREYMADANGARLIRDPEGLADALTKIKAYSAAPQSQPVKRASEMTASLYFSNPFKASSVANIFSTHPPIDERIKRLKAMY